MKNSYPTLKAFSVPEKTAPAVHYLHSSGQSDTVLQAVKTIVQHLFKNANGSHDWDHTNRVFQLCEKIGPPEGANMEELRLAAYLHDIGRCREDKSKGAVCHATEGAKMAAELLQDFPLSDSARQNIIHCIAAHRFRGNQVPATIEAKVLFDADKIDAIGAVGIARAYLFAGEIGAKLHNSAIDIESTLPYSEEDTGYREYRVKLSKIKNRIITVHGRRIAEKRHEFMELFFDRFLKEYHGKD